MDNKPAACVLLRCAAPGDAELVVESLHWPTPDSLLLGCTLLVRAQLTNCQLQRAWGPCLNEAVWDTCGRGLEPQSQCRQLMCGTPD